MADATKRVFKSLVMNPVAADRVDYYDPGYLAVRNRRIESLTRDDPRSASEPCEFIDLTGFAILPGLVDMHVHLPQFAIMGIGGDSLLTWLNRFTYPEEMRFGNAPYAAKISDLFFDALLANGTTCACIFGSVHEEATDIAFLAARERGLRAFIGKTMMNWNSPVQLQEKTENSLQASIRLFDKWDGASEGRLRYVFTPRFAAACSMELMTETAKAARERNAFIQSHLSENVDELKWIRSLFPAQSSYTAVYAEAKLLGERTIMGHCIHLTDPEIALLADSRTKIAFCPCSNRTLRSGLMPYRRLRDANLTIALGTDVAGGPSLSMFRQMGEALNSANAATPCLSPEGALYLATLAGAEALGIADKIGNFSAGKDADFIVVDHRRADPLAGSNPYSMPHQILARLCYCGDERCVSSVYIRGEMAPR